jgi:hypothetical protein
MKKWFLILLAIIGFSSFASAQKFTVGAGLTSQFSDGVVIGFGVNLGVEKLVKLGKDLDIDARVDFEGAFASAFFVFGVSVEAMIAYQIADFGIYAGPRATLFISPSSVFGFGALVGFRYTLTKALSLYLESRLLFVPAFGYQLALGLRYAL